ncbi:methyl-accepting chemotaxis protein [Cohnella fermenti]|uniref:Methyl-accepting chemotaxis protein n=1 Tax=Cohnella fermenti TaxID=2565925 RepID=A0A4S4BKS5_9BACL|nr:methyl-accepting chemotaxis protein [Cohnella fermenti]THF75241.1 methyl-accepting chemotaxis protein [Cohnella fermenti]
MNQWKRVRESIGRTADHRLLRFGTVQTRLTVFFAVLLAITIGITGIVSYRHSSAAISGKIKLYSGQIIEQIGAKIDLDIGHIQYAIEDIASSDNIQSGLADINDTNTSNTRRDSLINKEIAHKLSLLNYVSSIVLDVNGLETLGTYNTLNKQKLKRIVQSTEETSGYRYSLIEDSTSGKFSIAISKRIKSAINGHKLGTIIITIEEKHLMEIYDRIELGPGAELFIMDEQEQVVSSRNKDRLPLAGGPEDAGLTEAVMHKVLNGSVSAFGQSFGERSLISTAPVASTGWTVVSIIPDSFLRMELVRLEQRMLLIGAVCLIVAALVAYFVSLGVSVPSRRLMAAIQRVSEGDLSEVLRDPNRDEMGTISARFNDMVAAIGNLVRRTRESSDRMLVQSRGTAAMAEQFRGDLGEFAASMGQISEGSVRQAAAASEGSNTMVELADRIDRIGDSIEGIQTAAAGIGIACGQSHDTLSVLSDKTAAANAVFGEVHSHIGRWSRDLADVGQVARTIRGIARQTNILAVNARIEASRAGAAGRAFAVVAAEVRRLADETKAAAESIASTVDEVGHRARDVVESASLAARLFGEQEKAVRRTGETFGQISNEADIVIEFVNRIGCAADEMLLSKSHTLQAMEQIASVAGETAHVTATVYATTEAHLRETDKLTAMAQAIKEESVGMSEAISGWGDSGADDRLGRRRGDV